MFFIFDFLQDLVETADILPSVQSVHSTLKLKFSPINERSRGRPAGSSIIYQQLTNVLWTR